MMGTRRVRSVPRMSSASSNPFIPGIWTSSRASAKSWARSNSSASAPDRALSNSNPSRRSSASSARRFSSRSSTSKNLTFSFDILTTFQFPRRQSRSCVFRFNLNRSLLASFLINTFLADELGERAGVTVQVQALLRAQHQKSLPHQRVLKEADGAILQFPAEVDEHVAARSQMRLGEHRVRDKAVV